MFIIAVLVFMALLAPGCYSNGTRGSVQFPLTLLPDAMKSEDVQATIKADPTIMVTLEFSSRERLFGGASVQNSKKDVSFSLDIHGFMTLRASGGRSLEQAEVDAAALIEATGGAVGRAVHEAIGVP